MTGTGTQTDPYIVDNWHDLLEKMQEYDVYIELDPNNKNKIIDMNTVAPSGIGNISIKFKKLNGNGWTIKNIYCTGNYLFTYEVTTGTKISITFENLNIINIYHRGSSTNEQATFRSNNNGYPLNFRSCRISSVAVSSSTIYFAKYVNFYNCSMNVKFSATTCNLVVAWNQYGMCSVKNCDIRVNSPNINYLLGYLNVTDTKISGMAKKINKFDVDSRSTFSGLVVDLNTDCTKTINDKSCGLINLEKAPNLVAGTNMYLVTSEQMINDEYLTSIGFPIFSEG